MRFACAAAAAFATLVATSAWAGEMSSAFVPINQAETCAMIARGPGDGPESSVCAGWRGFPVISRFASGRLFLHFGFPPSGAGPFGGESFRNSAIFGPEIEWRIETDGDLGRPVATILDWKVLSDGGAETEVFVVQRIAGIDDRSGCVVGYVVSTGDDEAHAKALDIADAGAKAFRCGVDKATVVEDGGPLPALFVEPG